MASSSVYQQFLRALWARLKTEYPFASRLKQSFCVAIPKSSSFYLGCSPANGKHFILDFQHNQKPWAVGQFTINVHISEQFTPTENFFALSGFAEGEDGFYRLGSNCLGYDKWWCLRDRDRSIDHVMAQTLGAFDPAHEDATFFRHKWKPTSFAADSQVVEEAINDVLATLEEHVFQRFGFRGPTMCSSGPARRGFE